MAYDPLLTVDGGEAADDNPAETTPAVGQQAVRAKPCYDSDEDDERRAYVVRYKSTTSYPLEIGEKVWIVRPEYRSPLGEFRIVEALGNDTYKLAKVSDNSTHPELVAGHHLRRTSDL